MNLAMTAVLIVLLAASTGAGEEAWLELFH